MTIKQETIGVKTRSRDKHPSVLERNKLQEYLNHIESSSKEPTAEDIERHKPPSHAPPGTNRYETEYENLVECLSRSFTVKQLQYAHSEIFNLALPDRHRKRDLAISIIERQWKWPSLLDSMKWKERTEITTQTFPLETREAFLLLGKDGSNLHRLSRKFNVRTSFVSDPLSLAVKGVRESVERLARYIRAFKTDITENVVQLPTPQDVTLKLSQRVSRLSGALVESQDKQTLRVTYHRKEPRTSHIAKDACSSPESPPILACTSRHVGEASRGFSLYPFLPAHPLPWNVLRGGIYRMRNVGWSDSNEMKHTTLLSHDHLTMDANGKIEDLRKRLLPGVTDIVHSQKGVNGCQASLGHVLLCVPSMASNILIPPVTGNSPMLQLLQNYICPVLNENFCSIPRHRLGLEPRRQRLVHRLIYHAIPKYEKNVVNAATESIKLEFVHNFSSATEEYMDKDDESVAENDELPSEDEGALRISESGFWRGTQSLVNLMLPERAMDLQLSTTNFKETPEPYWPNDLRKYKETLHDLSTSSLDASRANLPLIFSDNGMTFALKSSSFIRQSSDPLFQGKEKAQVVSESILDLNSDQRYATCKIACEDPSEESWEQFLHACDLLTAHV
ncbi:hypothetical protein F5887DRAFT_1223050 [Amanita rubescens]|nr:hypothetical protein F5887DRAFT_1223050 [Amanita rubescens]